MRPDMPQQGTQVKGTFCPTGVLPNPARFGHYPGMSENNIAAIRKRRGLSQTELAAQVGTTLNMMGKLERGDRKLDQSWLERIGAALGVEPAELIARVNTAVISPDHPQARTADAGETVEIIQLDLSLPMGPGATVDDYLEEEPRTFDLAYIRGFTRTEPSRLRLARGVGDSMWPTLQSYDQVWIDSTQTNLNQSDRIWAVSINGGAAIKRLRPLKGGRIMVISDNPGPGHENYEVDADEVLIGGRVIRFARDL